MRSGGELSRAWPLIDVAEIAPTSRTPDPSTICLERLTEGEDVGGELICERKAIVTTASARVRFLAVGLRDDAGSIEARAFQNVDRLAAQFQPGDVVRVTGKVVVYRGELQLLLEEIECSGTEWPVPALARVEVDQLEGFLEHLVREHVAHGCYSALVESLLAPARTTLAPTAEYACPDRRLSV